MKYNAFFISLITIIGLLSFYNEAFALGGYWRPVKGKTYTITFTDEAKNIVVGEFKKTVRWQWEEDDSTTITEWDDEATFAFKDEAGNVHKIENATIKGRITKLEQGMVKNGVVINPNLSFIGQLRGNIKDVIK